MTASLSPKNKTNKPYRDRTGWVVLGAFVSFFAVFSMVDAFFVTTALRTHTGTVTTQPYEKGIAYNHTLATADKNQSEYMDVIATSNGQKKLAWVIVRKDGKSWHPTVVEARFVRPVAEGHDFIRPLTSRGVDGGYELSLDVPVKGAWQVHLIARDNQGTTHTALHEMVVQ